MRIWFNTTTEGQSLADQQETECRCDNPYPDMSVDLTRFAESDRSMLPTLPLKCASSLYIRECIPEHWLVCDPVGTGLIVVLDAIGLSLLEHFHTPNSLEQILPLITGVSREDLIYTVEVLYQLGILQDPYRPPLLRGVAAPDILTTWLHVTNACQLRCHYCYLTKNTENMADDTALRAVDAVFRSAVRGNFKRVKLKYAGGEASLRMNSMVQIHKYALQKAQRHAIELKAALLSNGVALSQRLIDFLKTYGIGLMISLDGIGEMHDSQRPFIHGQSTFKYVDRTINRLLTSGVIPNISVTVSQRNLAGLPDLMLYLLEHDLPFNLGYYQDNDCALDSQSLQFGQQQMIDAMQNVFRLIEEHLPARSLLGSLIDYTNLQHQHQHFCGVGHNYLVIDQHGGITKCQANIQQTITTIDTADPLRVIQQDRLGVQGVAVDEKEGCRDCDWRYWCAGGCPLLTHRITGRYDVKSPNCNIYQALFPEALRLEALRLLKYIQPNSW